VLFVFSEPLFLSTKTKEEKLQWVSKLTEVINALNATDSRNDSKAKKEGTKFLAKLRESRTFYDIPIRHNANNL